MYKDLENAYNDGKIGHYIRHFSLISLWGFFHPRGSNFNASRWLSALADPPTSQAPTSRKQRQHAQEPRTRQIDLAVLFAFSDFRRPVLACS